ncbi:exodeoxyribonuclease I [Candidatus Curculioniphilus buchneri]|uniref:exodeoxyribonuclease I n=1 Tax=Candidatus Curculioniphilus buchneri TaxID=690594 RepID=UPI00376F3154
MINEIEHSTFLIHDYETFGKNPAIDRPAQFAGLRTDSQFNPIDEPKIFLCRPPDDYLPDPDAVLMTGITPQQALRHGVIEPEFAFRVHQLFISPKTCVLGYNNIQFDDEVSRHLFYRNFYDPYSWSWNQGNSRWDLIDVMRSCYALRPEGIKWPINEKGLPSFRLEHLTYANGVNHIHPHDAMADVYATLAMAKLVRKVQPKLFNYLYRYRNKHQLKKLIDVKTIKPLIHVSNTFNVTHGNIAWIAPLAWHPTNPNILIACNLSGEMQLLTDLNSEKLHILLRTPPKEREQHTAIPLKLIHLNKCPVLVPTDTLRSNDAIRFGMYLQRCLDNLIWLRDNHLQIQKKIITSFMEISTSYTTSDNVDIRLYDGFFRASDRAAMNAILATSPENLPALNIKFIDPRLKPLLFRYRARNFPHTLNHDERILWLEYRKSCFIQSRIESYVNKLKILYQIHKDNGTKIKLINALFEYLHTL